MANHKIFKEKLEEELKTLEAELSGLGQLDKVHSDWQATSGFSASDEEADENDRADRAVAYEEHSATLGILEGRYHDVQSALKNIENGTYGRCEKCGGPIEEERLKANPAARTCIAHRE